MNLGVKAATAGVTASGPGEFDMILSNATRDRDGEELHAKDWMHPLPESIPINVNHSDDVKHIVGSGKPFIDGDGNLRVKGTYADTPEAQHIRSLVTGGHLRSVSVEFIRHKGHDGRPRHELVGGAFVHLPANPTARVLASKGARLTLDEFKAAAMALAAGTVKPEPVTKAVAPEADAQGALLQAAHDALVHLGAQCCPADPEFVQRAADSDPGDDDGVSWAAALRLRMKMLSRR